MSLDWRGYSNSQEVWERQSKKKKYRIQMKTGRAYCRWIETDPEVLLFRSCASFWIKNISEHQLARSTQTQHRTTSSDWAIRSDRRRRLCVTGRWKVEDGRRVNWIAFAKSTVSYICGTIYLDSLFIRANGIQLGAALQWQLGGERWKEKIK